MADSVGRFDRAAVRERSATRVQKEKSQPRHADVAILSSRIVALAARRRSSGRCCACHRSGFRPCVVCRGRASNRPRRCATRPESARLSCTFRSIRCLGRGCTAAPVPPLRNGRHRFCGGRVMRRMVPVYLIGLTAIWGGCTSSETWAGGPPAQTPCVPKSCPFDTLPNTFAIVCATPLPCSTNVPLTASLIIEFNQPIQLAGLVLLVLNDNEAIIDATSSLSPDSRTLIVTPTNPLPLDTSFLVVVSEVLDQNDTRHIGLGEMCFSTGPTLNCPTLPVCQSPGRPERRRRSAYSRWNRPRTAAGRRNHSSGGPPRRWHSRSDTPEVSGSSASGPC